MSNELTIWKDENSLKNIKEIYGKNLSDAEFKTLVSIGENTGLNPFNRELFAVKYGNSPAQIFIARDGYRKIAQQQPDYDGHYADAIYENDVFEVVNGVVNHKYNMKNRGNLVGAYCIVRKKNINIPLFGTVLLSEYNQNTPIWKEKKETMIKKVAESQGLRMAWQGKYAGTYDESEDWDNYNDKREEYIKEATEIANKKGYSNIDECAKELSKGKYNSVEDIDISNLPKFIEKLKDIEVSNNVPMIEPECNNNPSYNRYERIHYLRSISKRAKLDLDITDDWTEEQIEQSIKDTKLLLGEIL